METKINLHEVVKKLTGDITPIGDTDIDNKRLENLKTLCELTDKLLFDISQVAEDAEHHWSSVKTAGKYAKKFLNGTEANNGSNDKD